MKYIKAFAAGIIAPALLFPMIRYLLFVQGHVGDKARPIQFFFLAVPIAWGLWNVIYFALEKNCPLRGKTARPWVFGIALGFILSVIGVFIVDVPGKLFGASGAMRYIHLIICPLIYGFLWRYVVNFFNVLMDVE